MGTFIQFQEDCTEANRSYILSILPEWKTVVKNISGDAPDLKLKFIIEATTVEEINGWMSLLQEKNRTAYSIKRTLQCEGRYVKFKQILHCRHNTGSKKTYNPSVRNRTRNTNCPSAITITLKAVKKRYQGRNKENAPDSKMPCEILFLPNHNHSTESPDVLRFRPVAQEVKENLIKLYEKGHTPGTALASLKMEYILNRSDYEKVLVDRSICPDYRFCHYLYASEFKKKYPHMELNTSEPDSEVHNILELNLDEYNSKMGECSAKMSTLGSDYIICICPPLMKRAHKYIEAAGEVVFIDTSGTVDPKGNQIFVLLTPTEIGGVPLGVVVTSLQSAKTLAHGLNMLKDIVGGDIFHGKAAGPDVFITGNSVVEYAALQNVCPESTCLLSIFRVLQEIWLWLAKAKNGIPQASLFEVYEEFRAIVYANTIVECEKKYEIAHENAKKYSAYCDYLENYWSKREMWTLCFRNDILVSKNNINNYAEASMKVLKEKIFDQVKYFNTTQMLDFILTRFVNYYEVLLLDAARNSMKTNILNKLICAPPSVLLEKMKIVDDNIVLVPDESKEEAGIFYVVDAEVLLCGCIDGTTGKLCKHIEWACSAVKSDMSNAAIENIDLRKLFYLIAKGSEPDPDSLQPAQNMKEPDDHLMQGRILIEQIAQKLTTSLEESPQEMAFALESMAKRMQQMKPSSLASFCMKFGSGFRGVRRKQRFIHVQSTTVKRRKIDCNTRTSHVGGQLKKKNPTRKNRNSTAGM